MTGRFITTAEYENESRSVRVGRVYVFFIVLLSYAASAVAFVSYANKEHMTSVDVPKSTTVIDWGIKAIVEHIDPTFIKPIDDIGTGEQ